MFGIAIDVRCVVVIAVVAKFSAKAKIAHEAIFVAGVRPSIYVGSDERDEGAAAIVWTEAALFDEDLPSSDRLIFGDLSHGFAIGPLQDGHGPECRSI